MSERGCLSLLGRPPPPGFVSHPDNVEQCRCEHCRVCCTLWLSETPWHCTHTPTSQHRSCAQTSLCTRSVTLLRCVRRVRCDAGHTKRRHPPLSTMQDHRSIRPPSVTASSFAPAPPEVGAMQATRRHPPLSTMQDHRSIRPPSATASSLAPAPLKAHVVMACMS
jgi:hypothetical protein